MDSLFLIKCQIIIIERMDMENPEARNSIFSYYHHQKTPFFPLSFTCDVTEFDVDFYNKLKPPQDLKKQLQGYFAQLDPERVIAGEK
jgi:hypothetical protein